MTRLSITGCLCGEFGLPLSFTEKGNVMKRALVLSFSAIVASVVSVRLSEASAMVTASSVDLASVSTNCEPIDRFSSTELTGNCRRGRYGYGGGYRRSYYRVGYGGGYYSSPYYGGYGHGPFYGGRSGVNFFIGL